MGEAIRNKGTNILVIVFMVHLDFCFSNTKIALVFTSLIYFCIQKSHTI